MAVAHAVTAKLIGLEGVTRPARSAANASEAKCERNFSEIIKNMFKIRISLFEMTIALAICVIIGGKFHPITLGFYLE